jgi:hypothetical protein
MRRAGQAVPFQERLLLMRRGGTRHLTHLYDILSIALCHWRGGRLQQAPAHVHVLQKCTRRLLRQPSSRRLPPGRPFANCILVTCTSVSCGAPARVARVHHAPLRADCAAGRPCTRDLPESSVPRTVTGLTVHWPTQVISARPGQLAHAPTAPPTPSQAAGHA